MMELPRASSPASSSASSLDSNGLPLGRIKLCKGKILVGDRHFQSASDALLAYLRQFETPSPVDRNGAPPLPPHMSLTNGTSNSEAPRPNETAPDKDAMRSSGSVDRNGICLDNVKDEVQQLLTAKVSPELKEEVTDTLREIKLKHLLKKAVSNSQKPGKTGLQQEVEAALARSAQLLEKVTRKDIQSTKASLSDVSDISLPTQILLADAGGSSNSNDSILSQDNEDVGKRNGHVYSYHTNYLNHSTMSYSDILNVPISMRKSRHRQRNSSCDDLTLPNHLLPSPHRLSSSFSSNSSSKFSDLSDNLRRIRSRSVPPGEVQNEAAQLLEEMNKSGNRAVPSWLKEVSPNSSSLISRPNKRWEDLKPVIPQWVEDAAKSDIGLDLVNEHNTRIPPVHMTSKCRQFSSSYSKSEGDLSNWKEESKIDLNLTNPISSLHSSAKHVTFTDSHIIPRASHQPIHSTPLRGNYRQKTNSDSNVLGNNYTNGEALIPNSNLAQTIRSKNSEHKFLNANSSDSESDLKSSSFDTLALLTGKPQIRLKTSQGLKSNTLAQKVFLESPMLSSIEQDRTILSPSPTNSATGQVSSDGLDGDRSWERQTSTFKPPVPVGTFDEIADSGENMHKNLATSLSGGNQPGSMEALKNMLFKLQKEETSVNNSNSGTTNTDSVEQMNHNPSALPALEDYDFQKEPGGYSLEKALHHLDRLKTLVKCTATSGQTEAINGHKETEINSVTS